MGALLYYEPLLLTWNKWFKLPHRVLSIWTTPEHFQLIFFLQSTYISRPSEFKERHQNRPDRPAEHITLYRHGHRCFLVRRQFKHLHRQGRNSIEVWGFLWCTSSTLSSDVAIREFGDRPADGWEGWEVQWRVKRHLEGRLERNSIVRGRARLEYR